jgi:hypothetical protein
MQRSTGVLDGQLGVVAAPWSSPPASRLGQSQDVLVSGDTIALLLFEAAALTGFLHRLPVLHRHRETVQAQRAGSIGVGGGHALGEGPGLPVLIG